MRLIGDEIVEKLSKEYPPVKTALSFSTPFQLLIATILSAQTTDVSVNRVTPVLFARYPDAISMSKARVQSLEKIIMSTGFFHVKARRIRDVSRQIVREFHGAVPRTMEDLLKLNGVGRKTANIVLSVGFGVTAGIAVDTHVFRLSRRIGISSGGNPELVEQDLMNRTSRKLWPKISILLILHGRSVCFASKPECFRCVLNRICQYEPKNL